MKLRTPLLIAVTILIVLLALNQPARTSESIVYADFVMDEARNVLFGSCTSCNSVYALDLDTLEVLQEYSVDIDLIEGDDDPVGMDLSPDGNTLAVALNGSNKIAFIDLLVQEVLTQTLHPAGAYVEPPYDVQYGQNNMLFSIGSDYYRDTDPLRVYSLDTYTEIWHSNEEYGVRSRLLISADQNTLFIMDHETLHTYDISQFPPAYQSSWYPYGYSEDLQVRIYNNRLYTSSGHVLRMSDFQEIDRYRASGSHLALSDEYNVIVFAEYDSKNYRWQLHFLDFDTGIQSMSLDMTGVADVYEMLIHPTSGELIVSTDLGLLIYQTDFSSRVYVPLNHQNTCMFNFYEDFRDPSPGWIVGEDAYVRAQITDERYNVLTLNGNYVYVFGVPTCNRPDYYAGTNVKWLIMEPNASYGLAFLMAEDWSEYYVLDVNSHNQMFRELYRNSNGIGQSMYPTYSPVINKDMGENHLQVDVYGNLRVLRINGQVVAMGYIDWTKDRDPTGAALVTIPDSGTPKCEASFDNVSLINIYLGANTADITSNVTPTDTIWLNPAYTQPVTEPIDWPLPSLDLMEQR